MKVTNYLLPVFAITSTVNAGFFGKNNHPQKVLSSSSTFDLTGGQTKAITKTNPNEYSNIDSHIDHLLDVILGQSSEEPSELVIKNIFGQTSSELISFMSNQPTLYTEDVYYQKIDDINDKMKYLKELLDTRRLFLDLNSNELLDFLSRNNFITLDKDINGVITSFDFIKEQKKIFNSLPITILIPHEIRFSEQIKNHGLPLNINQEFVEI
mgnify:CR=1 FL=1